MQELKPCPFCGGKVNVRYISYRMEFEVFHRDANRDCFSCISLAVDGRKIKSLADAYEFWNRRQTE